MVFEKLTHQHVRILNGEYSDPTSSELLVSDVDRITILNGNERWIDA